MSKQHGQIIEAHLKMWPRESLNFRDGKKLPPEIWEPLNKPGIYILYRDDRPYYIGKAKRLKQRIHDHSSKTSDRHFAFWNYFSAHVVSDPKYLDDVEGILIAGFPTENSSQPRFKRLLLPRAIARELHEKNLIRR